MVSACQKNQCFFVEIAAEGHGIVPHLFLNTPTSDLRRPSLRVDADDGPD